MLVIDTKFCRIGLGWPLLIIFSLKYQLGGKKRYFPTFANNLAIQWKWIIRMYIYFPINFTRNIFVIINRSCTMHIQTSDSVDQLIMHCHVCSYPPCAGFAVIYIFLNKDVLIQFHIYCQAQVRSPKVQSPKVQSPKVKTKRADTKITWATTPPTPPITFKHEEVLW